MLASKEARAAVSPLVQSLRPSPAVRAGRWMLGGAAASRVAGFLGLAVVARLVDERLFGPYQQLVALHLAAQAVLSLGLDQLLVREKGRRGSYARALRAGLVASWALIALAAVLLREPLARALALDAWDARLLAWFPAVLALQALKAAMRPLHAARLDFRRIALGELLNTLALFGAAIPLCATMPSAAMLYLSYALAESAEAAWLWRGPGVKSLRRLRPSARSLALLLRRHRRFCAVITLDQGLNVSSNNAPALLLGGLLGPGAVGLHGMASRMITAPVHLLLGAIGRVALPALAGRPEEELRHRVLLALRASAAWLPPVLLWLAVFAPQVVLVVLGRDYEAAASLLPWLALNLLLQGLFSPISVLDVLRDKPEVTLAWNAACLLARCAALAVAAPHGLVAAIAAWAVVSAAMWLVYGVALAWLLGAGQRRFHAAWLRFAPLWALLAAALWACAGVSDPWLALVLSAAPLAIYLSLCAALDREGARLLWRFAAR